MAIDACCGDQAIPPRSWLEYRAHDKKDLEALEPRAGGISGPACSTDTRRSCRPVEPMSDLGAPALMPDEAPAPRPPPAGPSSSTIASTHRVVKNGSLRLRSRQARAAGMVLLRTRAARTDLVAHIHGVIYRYKTCMAAPSHRPYVPGWLGRKCHAGTARTRRGSRHRVA